ncbi:hypothetical protein C8Q80DRAFT_807338 [Daedaleopsis nitida]|nr:hypothetical protein C8Q80DRAFT_807338 [Daedaleopsis nitida]
MPKQATTTLPQGETVQDYSSYEDAAKAACAWVETGAVKVDRSKLQIYISKAGPMKGRVVGVGLLRPSGIVEDIIRIDNDNTGKGIHFNAKNLSSTSAKFAGRLQKTVTMGTPAERNALYLEYLGALENLQADTLWDWWRTGRKPTW